MKAIDVERFFWVDVYYACFGMQARDGVVTDAAPIVRWMIGKKLIDIKPWLLNRRAIAKEI